MGVGEGVEEEEEVPQPQEPRSGWIVSKLSKYDAVLISLWWNLDLVMEPGFCNGTWIMYTLHSQYKSS